MKDKDQMFYVKYSYIVALEYMYIHTHAQRVKPDFRVKEGVFLFLGLPSIPFGDAGFRWSVGLRRRPPVDVH